MTDDLIDKLTADVKPVGPHAMRQLFLRYATGGIVGGLAIMLVFLGVRHDLLLAMTTTAYWMKFGYAVLLLLILIPALFTLSRPVRTGLHWLPLAILLACLAGAASIQLLNAEPGQAEVLIWGRTALVCPCSHRSSHARVSAYCHAAACSGRSCSDRSCRRYRCWRRRSSYLFTTLSGIRNAVYCNLVYARHRNHGFFGHDWRARFTQMVRPESGQLLSWFEPVTDLSLAS